MRLIQQRKLADDSFNKLLARYENARPDPCPLNLSDFVLILDESPLTLAQIASWGRVFWPVCRGRVSAAAWVSFWLQPEYQTQCTRRNWSDSSTRRTVSALRTYSDRTAGVGLGALLELRTVSVPHAQPESEALRLEPA